MNAKKNELIHTGNPFVLEMSDEALLEDSRAINTFFAQTRSQAKRAAGPHTVMADVMPTYQLDSAGNGVGSIGEEMEVDAMETSDPDPMEMMELPESSQPFESETQASYFGEQPGGEEEEYDPNEVEAEIGIPPPQNPESLREFFPQLPAYEQENDTFQVDIVPPEDSEEFFLGGTAANILDDDKLHLIQIKESVLESYKNDKIAQDVIKGVPLSLNMILVNGLVVYSDRDGYQRLYIPVDATCANPHTHTDFPLPGEEVRTVSTLREELIRDVHGLGHLGMGKTLELMQRRYYWPGMTRDVKSYIKGCKECQQNKAVHHKPYGIARPVEVPSRRWDCVSMDFIMDLPRTLSGNNAILVCVDTFSKRSHFIPCKTSITGSQCAQLFYNEIYKHHGMPLKLISDREPRFTSDFWNTLFRLFGTQIAMSIAHRAQADGQTERTNRTLEEMLRAYTENIHHRWDRWLSAAEFQYNNSYHSAIKSTPFRVDTGQDPNDPHDMVLHDMLAGASTQDKVNAVNYAQDWKDKLKLARAKLKDAQELMEQQLNKDVVFYDFNVGDKVWLSTKFIKMINSVGELADRTKFDKRRFGPYEIIEKLSPNAYKLKLPPNQHFHPVQPVSRLEPVKDSDVFPEAHKQIPPLPVVAPDGEMEYEVDRVLAKTKRKGKNQWYYRVRYRGYPDYMDEWLPSSSVLRTCPELVTAFEREVSGLIRYMSTYLKRN